MEMTFSVKLINFIFKAISLLVPVKKRVVFLGSPRNNTLMENSQLVYDALDCDKKVIIKKMPHYPHTILYVSYFIMTSKVFVIDDHYRYFMYIPLKDNQKLIQLWHGPGAFKKVALDLPNLHPREYFTHRQYDAFITSAPSISPYIESGFHISSDKIKALGCPHSDLLINNQDELKQEFNDKFSQLSGKKVIAYLPTYRRRGDNVLDYDYDINWHDFDEFLSKNNMHCFFKRHPLQISQNIEVIPKDCKNITDIGEYSYFPILTGSDLLITDYSSVFFDYLLLEKPIIFYCPDAYEYLQNIGFYLDFPNDLPGDYCETFDELLNSIENPKNIDYCEFKDIYMKSCDGHSTERIVDLIKSYLK